MGLKVYFGSNMPAVKTVARLLEYAYSPEHCLIAEFIVVLLSVSGIVTYMGEVFRIIPEFRILRLILHRKSASNADFGRL